MATDELPPSAFALALAHLPEMGPARLRALTEARSPTSAWDEVAAGRAHLGPAGDALAADGPALARRWAEVAASFDVAGAWVRHRRAGISVADLGSPTFPAQLRDDPDGPALLLSDGDLGSLDGPRTAIVGTRDCTHAGRAFAHDLGRTLAAAGVRVVSGLALGIDGAAHAGALAADGAPPVAVVGSGLDVVYPRRHRDLWRQVAARGVVLSEHPLGTEPIGWHFLARNRIIAALAHVVVVVESHEHGGALHTASEAARRGREVLAVPGSVRSAASRGTNALLRDAGVCCDADDVLTVLGLVAPEASVSVPARARRPDRRDEPVLDAIGFEPCGLDALVLRTGLALGDLLAVLERLERDGWIVRDGTWCERADRR